MRKSLDRDPLDKRATNVDAETLVPAEKTLAWISADRAVYGAHRNRSRFRAILLAGNVVALIASFVVARIAGLAATATPVETAGVAILIVLLGVGVSSVCGLYSREEERVDHSTVDDLPQVLQVAMLVTWAVMVVLWLAGTSVDIGGIVALLGAMMTLPLASRIALRFVGRRVLDTQQTTVIVGAGAMGQFLARKLIRRPVHGLRLIGFVDDQAPASTPPPVDAPLLGRVDDLPELVVRHGIDRVLVAFSAQSHDHTVRLIRSLRALDVQVDVVPRLFDVFGPNVDVQTIDGLPLITRPRASNSRTAWAVKRLIDIVAAVVVLLVLSPLLLLITLVVKLDSRGPLIYRATRIGRDRQSFLQLKFRTMRVEYCSGSGYAGESAQRAFEQLLAERPELREQYERKYKLDPDPRVTRVGRLLRTASLDELPQLVNVIRGELSLVGPRPVTRAELERYGEQVPQLLSVRPGLTGYWQISGRSALGYDERVRLDLAYVSSWSLKLDAAILLRTWRLLVTGSGAV